MGDPHEIEKRKYDPECSHQRGEEYDLPDGPVYVHYNFCPWCGKYLGPNEPKEDQPNDPE